jgi:hypothetical protein
LLLAQPPDLEVGPRTEEAVRSQFITRKYQKLDWATTEPPPDPFEAILGFDFMGLFHAMNFGRSADKAESLTPLHAAVQNGDPVLVAIAACCTVDLDVLDSSGWTPLCYALFYGENEIAKFLLQLGAKPENAKCDICDLAMYNGALDLIDQILPRGFHREGNGGIMRPISTRFAQGRHASVTEVTISPAIKELVRGYKPTFNF